MSLIRSFIFAVAITAVGSPYTFGYSIRENIIRSAIPTPYKGHGTGIILTPSTDDISIAIGFGSACKEKPDLLEYAYLQEAKGSFFGSDTVYVTVETPLYLIARHALAQAREYRAVDDKFVAYASGLKAVHLLLAQQYMTASLRAFAMGRELLLLRDGVRVEAISSIQPWKGMNPFASPTTAVVSAAMARTSQIASEYMRKYAAGLPPDQRKRVVDMFHTKGMSDEQISAQTGWTVAEVQAMAGTVAVRGNLPETLTLSDADAVFAAEELKKPGKYEIIFRSPKIGMLGEVTTKEARVPISFATFR